MSEASESLNRMAADAGRHMRDGLAEAALTVKSVTGVDLTGLTDAQAQAACTAKGGVYHKADTPASVTDAQVAAATASATAPLQSQITTLQSGVAAVTAQFNAAAAARRALLARPLTLKLSSERGVVLWKQILGNS